MESEAISVEGSKLLAAIGYQGFDVCGEVGGLFNVVGYSGEVCYMHVSIL
jgi:hypothetical protein